MTSGDFYVLPQPRPEDRQDWLDMWPDYSVVKPPSDEILLQSWERLFDPDQSPYGFFVYGEEDDKLCGFLHYILHHSTWCQGAYCYMEDAYVVPEQRKRGAFSALYAELMALAEKEKWEMIYWITRPDNHPAQAFYDKVAKKTNWVRYEDKRH